MGDTTTITLEGLQTQIMADATAKFRTSSNLFNAVYTQSAGSALTVRFTVSTVPDAAVKQSSELAALTPVAVNIGYKDAALETVPVLARVSKISIQAPNASMKIAEQLAGGIAKAIDQSVTALFSDFTNQLTDGTTAIGLDDIFDASAELDSTEYVGQKILVLHPKSMKKVGKDLLALVNPNQKSADYLGNGYIATIGGIEIFVTPHVPIVANVAQNGMYFKEAIGMGYREPIIDITSAPNLAQVGVDVLADSYFKTVQLNDAAGVGLQDLIS